MMAAEKCIGAMDRLWFHRIVLFPEPCLFHLAENHIKTILPLHSSQNISQEKETSVASPITALQDEVSSEESDYLYDEATQRNRPTRSNLVSSSKIRSQSYSPISAQKKYRKSYNLGYSEGRLKKTMSCKSSVELELEEVRGFMDLGFVFGKESLSQRIMSLIPGLQRLDCSYKNEEIDVEKNNDDYFESDEEDGEEKGSIMRPYLSEAWLIRKPDSPLLNLRSPVRVSNAADMKKHLRYWAKTVASAIQQECS